MYFCRACKENWVNKLEMMAKQFFDILITQLNKLYFYIKTFFHHNDFLTHKIEILTNNFLIG